VKRVNWDPEKAQENERKHYVSFNEAQTVFHDRLLVQIDDEEHSNEEDRWFVMGESVRRRLVAVTYTIRDGNPWIISARIPTSKERRRYMKGDRIHDAPMDEPDPTAHLDWSKARRGALIPARGPITVTIEPVIAEFYRDEEAVNDALRTLICEGRAGKWSREKRELPHDWR
jgi:uncharacterized protein